MAKTTSIQIISSLLIFLFTYTALSKLIDHKHFVASLQTVAFFGNAYNLIAWGLPLAELVVALLLIFNRTRLCGLFTSVALLWAFTLYIAYMLLYIPNRPCSCGGVLAFLSWPQHLVFNVFFLFLSVVAILLSNKNFNKKWKPPGNPDTGPTLP